MRTAVRPTVGENLRPDHLVNWVRLAHNADAREPMRFAQLAKQAGIVDSTSEALRLIAQRGLKVNGDVVADKSLVVASGSTVIVQAGKRKFARVTVS